MKVYLGKPNSWFGPYQLAEKLCFWAKGTEGSYRGKPDWVHNFGEWLAYGFVEPEPKPGQIYDLCDKDRKPTLLHKFLLWLDRKKVQIQYVKIDRWDTWSVDIQLGKIVLPMLKQLKATKHGSFYVEDTDVPESLWYTNHETWEKQLTFKFYDELDSYPYLEARCDWVLNEIIHSFEAILDTSWQDSYRSGTPSFKLKKLENGNSQMIEAPSDYKVDTIGINKEFARIENGFRLFGKYYQNLWD
jgi:hypothetical protein